MFTVVSFREIQSSQAIINQGFSYVKTLNSDKDEVVLQNIQNKRTLLAAEGVQLVKLRNGVIIQGADHEDWEEDNFMLQEDMAEANKAVVKVVNRLETEEDDIKPYEMNVLSMGKSTLIERLKKGGMPLQIKILYILGSTTHNARHTIFRSIFNSSNC